MANIAAIEQAVLALPRDFAGPGGVVGVTCEGEVILEHAWGYADAAKRRPMTPATLMPICSISKQFTCAVLLDLFDDPAVFDARLAEFLPNLRGPLPTTRQLCNMQSGLRDYWALTVLHGAEAEGEFRREDARPLMARMRSTHFEPGSSYSYSNGNFRILSDLIEARADRSLAELYEERIFGPAGMHTARLTADTSKPADDTVGYEGNPEVGYFPAINRIFWTGDAGISASLGDMMAWEQFIDATRHEGHGLYRRLSAPQSFKDGSPSHYGFGLVHETSGGVPLTGHGGALRGFRLQRLHAPSSRLSVVVLLNHEADAHGAALSVMNAGLGHVNEPAGESHPTDWPGFYMDPATDLVLQIEKANGQLRAKYSVVPDSLSFDKKGTARSPAMRLAREDDGLRMERQGERLSTHLSRLKGEAKSDIAGRFFSEEIGGAFEVVDAGGIFHGGFEGMLGTGAMQPIIPVAEDVWVLPCQRSMDAPAPGDWTIRIRRGPDGAVGGLTIGCWLARAVEYRKAG